MKLNSIHAEYRAALFTIPVPNRGLEAAQAGRILGSTRPTIGLDSKCLSLRDEGCTYGLGIHRLRQH